tara:strand:- start:391 stop:606 length:216 start_codon:yes stop_codon:yes gene_type:complete
MKKEILEKLNAKKDKYPNIIELWEKMIEQKEKDLEKILDNCNKMLGEIDTMQNDLTKENILALYLLKIYST